MRGWCGAIAAGLVLVLAGCGGGGVGPVAGGGNGGGGDTGGGPGGGGGDGTPVSVETRMASINSFNQKVEDLAQQNLPRPQRLQQLATYMKSLPGMAEAGVTPEGTVVGRFTDNRYFLFSDAFQAKRPGGQPSLRASSSGSLTPTSFGARAGNGPTELPASKQARLLNSLHKDMNQPTAELKEMLEKRGYTVNVVDATVDNLKNVKGDGVLHWSSHGAEGRTRFTGQSQKFWSVWTSTQTSPENDQNYGLDLASGRLVYFTAVNGYEWVVKQKLETHYAITADFIKYYKWSFAPNSIAFINCCWSDSMGMTGALRALPSPVKATLGWNNAAGVEPAWTAARFFFDRMLGTNMEGPQEPGLQRPFDLASVYADMKRKNKDDASTQEYGATKLQAVGDGILAPTIKTMDVSERGFEQPNLGESRLTIHGKFGSDKPQSVTIDGTPVLAIVSHSPDKLVCRIKPEKGEGFSGNVVVTGANGIKSNAVPLTEWSGSFEYYAKALPGTEVATRHKWNVTFRTDVHEYRENCGDPLKKQKNKLFRAAAGSTCSWSNTGFLPGASWGKRTETNIPYGMNGQVLPPYGRGYIFEGWINPETGFAPLAINFLGCVADYTIPPAPGTFHIASTRDLKLIAQPDLGAKDDQGFGLFKPQIAMALGSGYSITGQTIIGHDQQHALFGTKLTYSTLTPRFAPTPAHQEDQEG